MRFCKCGSTLVTKAPQCNDCAKQYMAERRGKLLLEGNSKHDVYNYKWRKDNPEKYLFQTAKGRAKKYGLEFTISVEDIVIPEKCPVLGIPLFIRQGFKGGGKNPNNPSLDRINSDLGYIKGNVQVISWRANDLKKDGTYEEFKKLTEFLYAKKRSIL